MSTDWANEQMCVYDDVKDEGFALIIRQPGSPGEFNPDTMAWEGATDPVDVSTYAIRTEYKKNEIDGTVVQQGDCLLLVPAYGLQSGLDTTYQVLIDSEVQNVVHIGTISPGNVPLLFKIQVRE